MLIDARNLTKIYQMGTNEVHALRGVDLQVTDGEFLAIMGASGSGKSTMLHVLGCLDLPSDGSYRLQDVAVETLDDTQLSKLRNSSIGFVFQAFNLIPQHNVLENVELPLIYGEVEQELRRDRCLKILDRVGLSSKVDHKPTELSGGEAQRVAIARALAVEPLILLADEPTGNLDSQTGEEIMQLFAELNAQGTTILLVTHSRETATYAKRAIQMRDGRIVSDTRCVPPAAIPAG